MILVLRAIEYTIYEMEIEEARKKCDKLARERERINYEQNKVESDLLDTKGKLQSTETYIRKLDNTFKGMKDERTALLNEQARYNERKTEIELAIKDLSEDVDKERTARVGA